MALTVGLQKKSAHQFHKNGNSKKPVLGTERPNLDFDGKKLDIERQNLDIDFPENIKLNEVVLPLSLTNVMMQ